MPQNAGDGIYTLKIFAGGVGVVAHRPPRKLPRCGQSNAHNTYAKRFSPISYQNLAALLTRIISVKARIISGFGNFWIG